MQIDHIHGVVRSGFFDPPEESFGDGVATCF